MTKNHKCDGCDGSGCLCGDWIATDGECYCATPCPICLGVGSFSDQMPVADALADAETLRLALRAGDGDGGGYRRNTRLFRALTSVNTAEYCGAVAAKLGPEYLTIRYACNSARAAFRAVPGLRES